MNNNSPTTPAPKHRIRDSIIFAIVLCAITIAFLWQNYRISALQDQMRTDRATYYASIETMNEYIGKMRGDLHRNGYTITPAELPIYNLDPTTGKPVIADYKVIPLSYPLQGRLETLAGILSYKKFNSLPIKVKTIKNVDNKLIAIIDLQNKPNDPYTWEAYHFQNQTESKRTSVILTQTLLQPDYKGKWIDGVQFLFQGKPMDKRKYASLNGILLRKN